VRSINVTGVGDGMLSDLRKPANRFQFLTKLDGGLLPEGSPMRTPYGLEIIENCLACPHREERLFCNLPEHSVRALAARSIWLAAGRSCRSPT